jgi:hypothetical protein
VLIYTEKLTAEARAGYIATNVDPANASGRNGGAHFAYLDAMLKKNQGERGGRLSCKCTKD